MEYKIEFLEKPAQPVLTIRTRTKVENLPSAIGEAYGNIMQYLGELGEYPSDAPFVAYYNLDMTDLDVEIGFPVSKPIPGRDRVDQSEIPGGKQVSCHYTGPYAECGPAYEAMTKWVQDNGYEAVGTAYEFYLNDPAEVPAEKLETRIMFPLK